MVSLASAKRCLLDNHKVTSRTLAAGTDFVRQVFGYLRRSQVVGSADLP
jgi:hypothetical protein